MSRRCAASTALRDSDDNTDLDRDHQRPDVRKHYTTERGLLLIAGLGGPDGEILVEGAHNAVWACRVLVSRGIVGS